jgi:hypothetical protein
LEKNEKDMSDVLAAIQAKMKTEPSLHALHAKGHNKLDVLKEFINQCRNFIAEKELLKISDEVPNQCLEDVESLIKDQVEHSDGSKAILKRLRSIL